MPRGGKENYILCVERYNLLSTRPHRNLKIIVCKINTEAERNEMFYYLAMLFAVVGSVIYHLCIKKIPSTVNPFFTLFVAYMGAAALCLVGLLAMGEGRRDLAAISPWHFGLALGVVGIEIGFLLAYRVGWQVGYAAISVNVLTTMILIPLGVLTYQERFTLQKAGGLAACIFGLVLLIKK